MLHIEPAIAEQAGRHGLVSLSDWLGAPVGEVIADDADRQLVRLGDWYLKRIRNEKLGRALRPLARFMPPMGVAVREAALLAAMRKRDIDAARPLAWGQRLGKGARVESFIATLAVEGRGLDAVIDTDGTPRWWSRLGTLVGRANHAGFFQVVRLKDVIVAPADRLVLIDREAATPRPVRVTLGRCAKCLARSYAKLTRDRGALTDEQVGAFIEGYAGAHPCDQTRLLAAINQRLSRIRKHRRYQTKAI